MPYIFDELERVSDYPLDLILNHMSMIDRPDFPYLLSRKYLKNQELAGEFGKKVAVHLHVFYVDLLEEFLDAFQPFHFAYDLWITTDVEEKKQAIEKILSHRAQDATVVVTGNIGRDVLPMLLLKEQLSQYDYVGHFHTKKSKEADFWAGESWRKELIEMLVKPADQILANMEANPKVGITIADIPTFFRYTKIVDPWNENRFAEGMNDLWERMNLGREIDFDKMNTFIMSYGTFIWFKYDALKPLFDLDLQYEEIPEEPIPQHTILHSIERILVYLAWARRYDYAIAKNDIYITPFVDNVVLNIRPDTLPNTYINFDNIGGIKGALKYIIVGPGTAVKYILRRIKRKFKSNNMKEKL